MNGQRKTKKLPKEFKQYFWEYDFKKIKLPKCKDLILERILNFGRNNKLAMEWLFDNFGEDEIKEYVLTNGVRQLYKVSSGYWRDYYKLPPIPEDELRTRLWPH